MSAEPLIPTVVIVIEPHGWVVVAVRKVQIRGSRTPVVFAFALVLLVAIPSVAAAYQLGDSNKSGATSSHDCSLDARILKMEPGLCTPSGPGAVQADPAVDPAPAPSARTDFEFGWWAVGVAATVLIAGAIVTGFRARPQALS